MSSTRRTIGRAKKIHKFQRFEAALILKPCLVTPDFILGDEKTVVLKDLNRGVLFLCSAKRAHAGGQAWDQKEQQKRLSCVADTRVSGSLQSTLESG